MEVNCQAVNLTWPDRSGLVNLAVVDAADRARLGARIRKARQQKGYSQRAVAEPLMTAAYLCLIEAGWRVCSEAPRIRRRSGGGGKSVEIGGGRVIKKKKIEKECRSRMWPYS